MGSTRKGRKRLTRSRKAKAAAPKITTYQHDNQVVYRAGKSRAGAVRRADIRAFANQDLNEFVYESTPVVDVAVGANTPQKVCVFGTFGCTGGGGSDGSGDVGDFLMRRGFSYTSVLHSTQGTGAPALPNDSVLQFRALLVKCRETITIRNGDNSPINVNMFRCYPRRDIGADVDETGGIDTFRSFYNTCFTTSFQGAVGTNDEDSVKTRFATQAANALGSPYAKNITPFQSTLFCRQFKIREARTLHIPAGEFVEIQHTETPMKPIAYSKLAGNLMLKGVGSLTVLTMHNRAWTDSASWTTPEVNCTRVYSFKMMSESPQRRILTYSS